MARGFAGGVHPPEFKIYTDHKPIVEFPLPGSVVVPLQQHIGAPSEVLVNEGDTVKSGQQISQPRGFVSIPSHASISGTVKSIAPFPHPQGQEVMSVLIEGDGNDTLAESIQDDPDYGDLPVEELKKRIADAGLAGMGGAGFPTHVKLSPPPEKKIDTAILNGSECEPFLTADHRLMVEQAAEILSGFKTIMKILGVDRGYVGIEDNKPDAIEEMRRVAKDYPGIDVIALRVKYPQGAEKQLIYAATGRSVPPGKLPMEVGCVVSNVGSAKAVYDAVALRKPLIERIVTVTGAVVEPQNLRVRIGTPVRSLIDFCGGFPSPVGKVLVGGPMMGVAQYTLDAPVVKGTSGIVVLRDNKVNIVEPDPCIKCGSCVNVCPMHLMPCMLEGFILNKKWEAASEFDVTDCIECGSCSYICPAGRRLVQSIRYGKYRVMKMAKKESAVKA